MLKVEVCAFSGLKIYPGHGKRVTRADGKTQIFLNSKCERNHALKRNPRKINWTVLYRRKHRKGMVEEAAKKRTRRTQKFMRAVTGATLADIMAKRNQKPEVRQAQREQAVRAAKEKKQAKEAKKEKKVEQKAQMKAPCGRRWGRCFDCVGVTGDPLLRQLVPDERPLPPGRPEGLQ